MKDGLPSNEVHDLFQDSNGYMWMATDRGLVRYDGEEFLLIREEQGLPNPSILTFIPESEEKIWIVTIENKMYHFNPLENPLRFSPYKFNDTLSATGNAIKGNYHIRKYWKDAEGKDNLSFRMTSGRVQIDGIGNATLLNRPLRIKGDKYDINIHYADKKNLTYAYSEQVIDSISPGDIWLTNDLTKEKFKIDCQWSFEIMASEGVTDFEKNQNGMWVLIGPILIKIKNDQHTTVELESDGIKLDFYNSHIYVSTQSGGVVLDSNLDIKRKVLEGKFLTTFRGDQNGAVWISTLDEGVFYTQGSLISSFGGTKSQEIYGSLKKVEEFIIAIDRHFFITIFNSTGKIIYEGVKVNQLNGIYLTLNSSGLEKYLGPEVILPGFENPGAKYFYDKAYSKDSLWSSVFNYAVFLHLNNKVIKSYNPQVPRLRASIIQQDSTIILATEKGLYKMEFNGNVTQVLPENHLLNDRLLDVQLFKDGLLVATRNKGIIYIQDELAFSLRSQHGLTSNDVTSMIVHSDELVTVGTYHGINRVSLQTMFTN